MQTGVEMPPLTLILFCAMAWASGALFGRSVGNLPDGWVTAVWRVRPLKRRRRGRYYFADDERTPPKNSMAGLGRLDHGDHAEHHTNRIGAHRRGELQDPPQCRSAISKRPPIGAGPRLLPHALASAHRRSWPTKLAGPQRAVSAASRRPRWLFGSAAKLEKLPVSTTLPRSTVMTQSANSIIEGRCAIVTTVQ